jgi:ABC-type sugar transport system ATPase subunit
MFAVEVTDGYKYFGSSKDPLVALDRINVSIKCGTLYSLLGPSACGKTVFLSVGIMGVIVLNSLVYQRCENP